MLLGTVIVGPLDERVRDRIVAETRGNPLALLELPLGRTPAELAGGFALPDAAPLSGRIEDTLPASSRSAPLDTRRLLLVAAAEPSGDSALVLRAAERLGLGPATATPAREAGLLERGPGVLLRHPLVRSAVYRAETLEDRRSVHQALAEATDPQLDPDRRAWHRAQSASGPDAEIAAELERSAWRAQARGGYAAAAAFLERDRGVERRPGAPGRACARGGGSEASRGRTRRRARAAGHRRGGPDGRAPARTRGSTARPDRVRAEPRPRAPALLAKAAKRLEPLDAALARSTYRDAFTAAWYAGGLADGAGVLEVAQAAREAPASSSPAPASDLVLDGVALLTTGGYAVGAPIVQRSLRAFLAAPPADGDAVSWLGFACRAAHDIWDDRSFELLATRFVELVRDAGALSSLPFALSIRAIVHLFVGEFAAAGSVIAELQTVVAAMGSDRSPYADIARAGMRGRESETSRAHGCDRRRRAGTRRGAMARRRGLGARDPVTTASASTAPR